MARGRMDANHRPNTLKENKMVLCELRSRGKIEHKTSQELSKLFAKLNANNTPKHWKNGKTALGGKQEKMSTEHPYGPVEGFPPGSWWGIRMDCSRDRVHSPFSADIQDGPAGVVSLCTSHLNSYNDEDLGDSLTFTGNSYDPDVQSDDPLLRSYQSQVPFRLVRSYNLTNNFAPKTGYRYDGLYTVATYWIGISSDTEKHYKFALVRVRNQNPPAWQKSSGVKATDSRKIKSSQTRCNIERFSTNLCSESHDNANEQDTTSSSRFRTETIKFSFGKSANDKITDKLIAEGNRNTHESTIVTRCTSVKKVECPLSSNMVSVPYSESTVQKAHRIIENSSKPTPCKLQNTNISIRTDLYDSSHNIQYETKKGIPMTFCRTYGSARNTRVLNHAHVGTLNLNSCGPCPRDGEQESLIQSRSGISKISATQSPCSDSNRSAERSTPNIYSIVSPIEAKTLPDPIESRISEITSDANVSNGAVVGRTKDERLDKEQRNKENSPAKMSIDTDDKATSNNRTMCPITRMSVKKNIATSETNVDEVKDEMLKEQRTAFDSLTPDQMLKYIVKRKYHPTAKLLIGSVIGLATGESKILRTYDSLISRNKSWSRNKKLDAEKNESPISGKSEKPLDRRQSTGEQSTKKERNVGKSATKKRGMKERIFSMRLRRTRVSKRLLGTEKKSNAKNANSSSQRLRSKDSQKTQQPFSKSTSLKNSQRSVKKRRSELANLAIDANFGPKIRGPRNRRLRGKTNIFARKRYDIDISSCRRKSRSDVNVRAKKEISERELPAKRSKRLTSAAKTQISQSHFMEHKKRVQKTETTNVEQKIQNSANTLSQTNLAGSSKKGVKRRVSGNQTRSREQVYGKSNDSTKKMCRRAEKDVSTIQNVITMVDAATQCSNRRDVATCIDMNIEQPIASEERGNSVKVEWIDLDDVKSESCESDEEQFVLELASERYENDGIQISREQPEIQKKPHEIIRIRPHAENPQTDNITQRLSAFVPVNISDNDLRIARLRSIGFMPIEPAAFQHEKDQCASGSAKNPSESTVISRVADEQYNKYTSEESTLVGYMDQELRYEDIEEDVVNVIDESKNLNVGGKTSNKIPQVRDKNLTIIKGVKVEAVKTRQASASLEDDSELPWHGWKKFVKNKQAHWVGW